MLKKRDFLSITDFSKAEIVQVLDLAVKFKREYKRTGKNTPLLQSKTLIMIFEKPSLRTHASFEIGMTQLGGHAIYFGPQHIDLGKREPIEHGAKVLSAMANVIMARVFAHETVIELAKYSTVPVINGLSDREHPCQILADLLTIKELKGGFHGLKLAYFGDGENNIPHSLALVCGILGMHFVCASPKQYEMKREIASQAKKLARNSGGSITETADPKQAITQADVVYTDTWVSMGDEKEKSKRLKIFPSYRVDSELIKMANPNAVFMHDMPAYLGNEVTKEVFDGPQSVVYTQAENRLHVQKALLVFLLTRSRV